ncbi:MAG: PIN domain-containing protein [Anaerolineales bacterium]|nr:MAG: PIN domain-containing protein [Anaerolineales bacterium]
MTGKLRVLIDLNLILDVLQKREPFYVASAQVLACVETGLVEGLVAAHTITTLFYLIAKDRSTEVARVALTELLHLLSVAAVDHTTIEQALSLPYNDFEDAVQMMAAVQAGAQYVVTRNIQDYRPGPLPALQPAELLTVV